MCVTLSIANRLNRICMRLQLFANRATRWCLPIARTRTHSHIHTHTQTNTQTVPERPAVAPPAPPPSPNCTLPSNEYYTPDMLPNGWQLACVAPSRATVRLCPINCPIKWAYGSVLEQTYELELFFSAIECSRLHVGAYAMPMCIVKSDFRFGICVMGMWECALGILSNCAFDIIGMSEDDNNAVGWTCIYLISPLTSE